MAVFVGVFDSRKNVEWLVKTWVRRCSEFADWRLLLVGPTSRDQRDLGLRTALQEVGARAGLTQKILFHDYSPRAEDYYRAADAFILPSHNEGMPNAVLEAMACGLACVVTRISGTTDLITHGHSGMLFDVNDEAAFVAAMSQLSQDNNLRDRISARASSFISEQYSVGKISDKYLQLYHEMLGAE